MAALPYIQLYVADYLADTMHLTTEEHGAYLLLIMNYWQTGKPLPKPRLRAISKLSNERWAVVEQSLKEYFSEDENGCWVHDRIEEDLQVVLSKSTKASRAGKASAAKRAAKAAAEKKAAKAAKKVADKLLKDKEIPAVVDPKLQLESNHTDTDTDTDIKKQAKKVTKKKAAKKKPDQWILPDWVNPIAWSEFEQHRKEARKPMSDLAKTKAAGELKGFTFQEQQIAVNNTIQNSWTGVFPKKTMEQSNEAGGQLHKPPNQAENFHNMLEEAAASASESDVDDFQSYAGSVPTQMGERLPHSETSESGDGGMGGCIVEPEE